LGPHHRQAPRDRTAAARGRAAQRQALLAHGQEEAVRELPGEDAEMIPVERLGLMLPGPVVALNQAVAIAMADSSAVGLARIDALVGTLDGYHLLHAARADLLRRDGRLAEAATAYRRALDLTANAAERRFLVRRLRQCTTG